MNKEYAYVGSELELFSTARNWKRYWASHVRPHLGDAVFDVGAGTGANLDVLYRQPARWTCIEPDWALAAQAQARINALGYAENCQVFHGTLSDLEPGRSADTIIYIDVLEHIDDAHAEMRLASERLRPGGRMIALCPAQPWLFSPFDKAVGHFRRYTLASLADTAPANLTPVSMVYLDSVGLLASAANKMFLKASYPKPKQIALWDRAMVPCSRIVDKLVGHRIGKSVLGIWQK